jgi:phosphoenolpyruvate phosphomutase
MADTCSIPIIADCDTGFGGPSNVSHMVKKYENAGIAAISIEDKIFPKQNSLLQNGTQKILPEKDFVAKLIAAKNAKINENFLIIARVEALIAGLGVSEASKRADAYEKAGADAILIHSKKNTPDEIFEFCDTWDGKIPIIVIPTSYPNVTLDELQNHKVKMVIYANQSLRASHWAMAEHLSKLSTAKSLSDVETKMTTMEDIFHLQEMYEIKKQEIEIEKNLKKLGYIN